jgi:subtilisin family serine protease
MAKRPVLIELYRNPRQDEEEPFGEADSDRSVPMSAVPEEVAQLLGLQVDLSFPVVTLSAAPTGEPESSMIAESDQPEPNTYLIRGALAEDEFDSAMANADEHPDIKGIFADPVIGPCLTCLNSPAVGTAADVARMLCVPQMAARGMNGTGVLLAIVDSGINLAFLRSRGLMPNFNGEKSWVPQSSAFKTPGAFPVGHGTMCAFDALIAAPQAILLDIAVLSSRRPGATAIEGLLSDAVLGYEFLLRLLTGPRRPGDFHSMVVSNSWMVFKQALDFPVGNPGNYSDNLNHPFNRVVTRLASAGADILFAAGNCGRECPQTLCGGEVDTGILGANSHPQVTSVAGVDLNRTRVGYSNRGPGRLAPQKPDISCYTHFEGSGIFPVDAGTSAATPVAAGVVAAIRSQFPVGPATSPQALRGLLTTAVVDRGTPGFDLEFGSGIIDGCRLANS